MPVISPGLMKGIIITAGIALVLLTSSAYANKVINKKEGKFFMPMIEQEWARNASEMKEPPSKGSLIFDTILFVPLYVVVFYILASQIQSHGDNKSIIYFAILACAIVAALADWTENFSIWQIGFGSGNGSYYDIKTYACFVKWLLIGVAAVFVSLGYASIKNFWVAIPGFINAVILLYGTIFDHALIQWGFGLLGIVLLIVSIFL